MAGIAAIFSRFHHELHHDLREDVIDDGMNLPHFNLEHSKHAHDRS